MWAWAVLVSVATGETYGEVPGREAYGVPLRAARTLRWAGVAGGLS